MSKKTIIITLTILIPILIVIGVYMYGRISKLFCTRLVEDAKNINILEQNKATTITTFINITDDEAKAELQKDSNIILLDVRAKEEYDEKHIPNSILIPVNELETRALNELKDKNTKIFVYCRSGNRSITASNILINLGYTNVYNLGGIIDWKYETE